MLLLLVLPHQPGCAHSQDRRIPKKKTFQGPQQIPKKSPFLPAQSTAADSEKFRRCLCQPPTLGFSVEGFGSDREVLPHKKSFHQGKLCWSKARVQPEKGLELPCSLNFTQKSPKAFSWLPSQPELSLDSPFCRKENVRAKASPAQPCCLSQHNSTAGKRTQSCSHLQNPSRNTCSC